MAASLVLAGREAGNKSGACSHAVERFIASYCTQMRAYAPLPVLEMARAEVSRLGDVQPVHAALHKAVRATPAQKAVRPAREALERSKPARGILTLMEVMLMIRPKLRADMESMTF